LLILFSEPGFYTADKRLTRILQAPDAFIANVLHVFKFCGQK